MIRFQQIDGRGFSFRADYVTVVCDRGQVATKDRMMVFDCTSEHEAHAVARAEWRGWFLCTCARFLEHARHVHDELTQGGSGLLGPPDAPKSFDLIERFLTYSLANKDKEREFNLANHFAAIAQHFIYVCPPVGHDDRLRMLAFIEGLTAAKDMWLRWDCADEKQPLIKPL